MIARGFLRRLPSTPELDGAMVAARALVGIALRGLVAVTLGGSVLIQPVSAQSAADAARPAQPDVASYQLAATLDVVSKQVSGQGRIVYRNPSTDTLKEVWLRLYLNAFRSPDTLWMREAASSFRGAAYDPQQPGWIRVERLALANGGPDLPLVDGDVDATTARVALPDPLAPGATLTLEVAWTAQLPRVFARTGFANDFFMVGQWYPKLAVYDRGRWDTEPWHANAEFFHDFGTYDLALTVPAGYITGASGQRQSDLADGTGSRTTRYRAERVTDVAWTAWPSFQVVTRDLPVADTEVQVELLLPPTELGGAERHLKAIASALDQYGRWYGPYPWPKVTVVVPPAGAEGAAGMEYPTLVSTGSQARLPFGLDDRVRELEVVTFHEIAHQWFPMQVQSNEAAEPWLDEGFAEYLTIRGLAGAYGQDRSMVDLPFARIGYGAIQRAQFAALAVRQPLNRAAWEFPDQSVYGATAYGKGSTALVSLERLLGDERFTPALRAYTAAWRWRHPTTADLQQSLEAATSQSLASFFQPFVYGGQTVEFRVTTLGEGGGQAQAPAGDSVVVVREGTAAYPVEVATTSTDGDRQVMAWDGVSEQLALPPGQFTRVRVDPGEAVALQANRLDDARVLEGPRPNLLLAAAVRWLTIAQQLLQVLGQVG